MRSELKDRMLWMEWMVFVQVEVEVILVVGDYLRYGGLGCLLAIKDSAM